MPMKTLDESSVVVAADHTTSAEVDGESVILDLDGGVYYGLNSSGSRIWKKLQEKKTIEELIDEITKEYDVGRSECEDDIFSLVQDLRENNLINIIDAQKIK
jgi:hypothetical protein